MVKRYLVAAKSRGSEMVVHYTKPTSLGVLEFLEEYPEEYTMGFKKSQWKTLGYRPQRVFDLDYLEDYNAD